MIKISHLTVTTHKGRKLIDDFSYVINKGEKIALIGEEGNGKSTLLKIVAGIDVSDYVEVKGSIETRDHVSYLPQRLPEEDLGREVFEYLLEGREYEAVASAQRRMGVDLSPYEGRKIETLSGGERVKVALARVLSSGPDILLLDEPTNNLDLSTLIWLEEFIRNSDLGILFISHDETLLKNCAEGIIHLEQLKRKVEPHITVSGEGYEDYQKRRRGNIDKTNQVARKEKAELNKQLERYRQIYQKVEHRMATISRGDPHGGQLLKKKMKSLKAQGRKLDEKDENRTKKYEPEEAINIFFPEISLNPSKVIIRMENEELSVDGVVLAKDISLHIEGKDKVCLIGENGTGKTTLLKKILSILQEREDLHVGYMPQNYEEVLDMTKSPVDHLMAVSDKTTASNLLGSLKFTSEEMTHAMRDLSEGQKCKILLASLILQGSEVLVLDEPTRNLSPLSGPELRGMLEEYKGCIIAVSHDRLFIDEVAKTVYELTKEGLRKID